MKRKSIWNYILSLILTLVLTLSMTACGGTESKPRAKDIAILYTNDVHCAVDDHLGYDGLAAFRSQLVAEGMEVILVDAGDAIQGAPIGSLSKGSLPIELMNQLGYSAMTLGNHEFDFGLENLSDLAKEAKFPFLSLNFIDNETQKPVYQPYTIVEGDGIQIAFVGVSTPKTITSSTPAYFMDEAGNFKYSFLQDDTGAALWEATQQAVDAARKEGADYVIALTHLGIDMSTAPYMSTNLIANTSGIDVVLDGHSHSVIGCERVQNKEGKRILLSSTGTALSNMGYLLIDQDGNLSTGLVSGYEGKDEAMTDAIQTLRAEFEEQLKQPVASLANSLLVEDPATGVRLIRNAETNLGDLCADAIREATGADVAIMNGGGIRASIQAGEATYGDVLSVFPFGNRLRLVEVSGQQLLDALELSVSAVPTETGGFLQVSGLTFVFRTDIPTPVVRDTNGMFSEIKGERRVHKVLIGDTPLDPNGKYSLGGIAYTLRDSGDGYSMFADCPVLEEDVALDFDALVRFLTEVYPENLDAYREPYGQGRIVAMP